MKTFSKLFSLIVLLGVASTTAFAQTSGSDVVAASATIVGSLTVANNADLDFGDILTSDTPAIAATDANAGSVSVTGATSGQALNVTATFPATLTDGTPANDLTLSTYDIAVRTDGTDDPTGASSPGDEATSGQDVTGSVTAGGSDIYIYVGAAITSATNGVAGNTYENDITVSVDYN